MMMAVVAAWPKVIGSRSEMVATGPMPGSTPIAVRSARQQREEQVLEAQRDAEAERQVLEKDVSMVRQVPLRAPEGALLVRIAATRSRGCRAA
jgi:hypothetical protein